MLDYNFLTAFSTQIIAIISAFLLCLTLGIERHLHLKDAGIKTHVLVGVGACVFTLVSAYGFTAPLDSVARFDPSRIAAQIVSGIGFLGAGVIFVNNDTVRGLTTAATIWLSAAIGMACGAKMVPLAIAVTLLHYILVFIVGPITHRLPQRRGSHKFLVEYEVGKSVMPHIIQEATTLGFTVAISRTTTTHSKHGSRMQAVMDFHGGKAVNHLAQAISETEGVDAVELISDHQID